MQKIFFENFSFFRECRFTSIVTDLTGNDEIIWLNSNFTQKCKNYRKIEKYNLLKFPPLCNSIWSSMIKKWKVSQLDHIPLHNGKTKIFGHHWKQKGPCFESFVFWKKHGPFCFKWWSSWSFWSARPPFKAKTSMFWKFCFLEKTWTFLL